MTYKEAYSKIIDAYFKDEIKPMKPLFCFCGTLCGSTEWYGGYAGNRIASNGYNGYELGRMEAALIFDDNPWRHLLADECFDNPNYEDALFNGMCAALEVLKEIHRNRGENVDEVQTKFTKREKNENII